MCEDCNRSTGILTAGTRYFDSCMREDCNLSQNLLVFWCGILIHTCARIATGSMIVAGKTRSGF